MPQVASLSPAQLLAVYNYYADAPIKKFASSAIGRNRLVNLLEKINAPECQAIAAVLSPPAAPVKPRTPRLEAAIHARVAKAAAKPATPAAEPTTDAPKYRGIWAEAAASAARGWMPLAPDFSADTHKPYRAKLATLVGLAKARDIEGLEAVVINPTSSSPKALARYRDICVTALRVKAAG